MSDAAPRRWRSSSKCAAAELMGKRLPRRVAKRVVDGQPNRTTERQKRAVAKNGRAGVELPTLGLAEWPAHDDAVVPRARRRVDPGGQPPEDADTATPIGLHSPASGAIERRPAEALRCELRRDTPRRDDAAIAERRRPKAKAVAAR